MNKVILSILLFISISNVQGQAKKSNNASLDSLKQSVRAIGNIFKKAGVISITVNQIDSTDNNLIRLKQNIKQSPGVTKIKESYEQNNAVLMVTYKGRGTDLWQGVPPGSKQMFNVLSVNDTAINLDYKYSRSAVAAKPATPANDQQGAAKTATKTAADKATQSTTLSKGAAVLFKNVKTKLSDAEKNLFFSNLGFKLAKDGKQFSFPDPDSEQYPFAASLYPTDLNKDGVEEIFVLFGNTYTSGMTGSNIVAYVPNIKGTLEANLGFPGTLPSVLPSSNKGYPDLLIGGPGFEFPVWRWNGKAYDYLKTMKEAEFLKLKYKNLEDLSKAYTDNLK